MSISWKERLAARLGRVRERRTEHRPNDRWMLAVGGVLLPVGFAAVLLGWAGVTHTVYVYDQLTYLASGSLVGIALVIIGGFIYFTYWQSVRVREARAHHAESQATLERIESLLAQSSPSLSMLVATSKGTMVHRATCEIVKGRSDLIPVLDPTGRKLCGMCNPLASVAS